MQFHFQYKIRPLDLWQLAMYGLYHSMIGICNLVFSFSMIILTVTFWGSAEGMVRGLLVIGISLFTVLQPLAIYSRARKQCATMPQNMEMTCDMEGLHICCEQKVSHLKWACVRGFLKRPNLFILLSSKSEGYMIPYRVLGEEKERFQDFLQSQITNYYKKK